MAQVLSLCWEDAVQTACCGLVQNNRTGVIDIKTMLGSSWLQFIDTHLSLISA